MQEFRRLTVPGLCRVLVSDAVKMRNDLFRVIKQLVKIPSCCKHRLHHHAEREQA
ncbi:hypothetical protein [Stenotrophomonas sp. Ste96]|uniref:hypothetical protein n=1 Tax=Stenotrophomonas sp. Ste96 TaxID=2926029 RepID=UPI00131300C6|nr:hypothetical protein [Stenotrophomonas sp. Ste96]